ncbi:hypothetical protein [Chryseobacterium shigense]|uniref:Uncharacterized protein n=1 Tax=Chryseobacterium shigense TaxID=297244 RepID=A0A841NEA8_9FLAO|nr:hypothetical protein [Chryseobacterium shigense]MBB6370372.1 hypothetical protein [Chryseobacterium shigense]
MKTKLLFWAGTLFLSVHAYSQVGITTATPSSTLDIRGSIEGNFREITEITGPYTLTNTDYNVSFSGTSNAVLSIPSKSATDNTAADFRGRKYYVSNNSTASILTLTAASGDIIRLGGYGTSTNTYVLQPGTFAVITAGGANGWDVDTKVDWKLVDMDFKGPILATPQNVPPTPGSYDRYIMTDSPVTVTVPFKGAKVELIFTGYGETTGSAGSGGYLKYYIKQTGTALAEYGASNAQIIQDQWYNYNGTNGPRFNFSTTYSVTNLDPGTYTFSFAVQRAFETGTVTAVRILGSTGKAEVYIK